MRLDVLVGWQEYIYRGDLESFSISTYNNVFIVLDSSGSWKGKNTLNMKFVIRGVFWGESKGGGKLLGGEPWEGKGAK